jgi:hypothetical protein
LAGADAVALSPLFHRPSETSEGQTAEITQALAHVAGGRLASNLL